MPKKTSPPVHLSDIVKQLAVQSALENERADKAPAKKKAPPKKRVESLAGDDDMTPEDIAAEREAQRKESLERFKRVPPLYYNAGGSFWFKPKDRFLEMTADRIRAHLRKRGLRKKVYFDGEPEIDWPFLDAEENRVVDYAGSLAGHRVGIYRNQGRSYLVTEEPEGVWDELPEIPLTYEPPIFGPFVKALLPGKQWEMFCYWLAFGLMSLRNHDFKAGQMVWLCGPRNCGKSLAQTIVKLVLGGREANPFYYMSGATDFNYDMMGSECWSFEDPPSQSDYKSRCEFGERLKECCNNDTIRGHRKNKDSMVFRVFRRLIGSINSKAEHIQRIPPMLDGTADKNFIFKCDDARHTLAAFVVKEEQTRLPGMGEAVPVGQQDRAGLYAAVVAEIPLIRAWLMKNFRNVPPEWMEDRMGIRAWQNPELLAVINDMTPEAHLLCLIDQYCWNWSDDMEPPLDGTAHEIYMTLKDKTKGEVSSICKNAIALGRYIARIKELHPDRVSDRMRSGNTIWTISRPQKPKEEPEESATPEEMNDERQ